MNKRIELTKRMVIDTDNLKKFRDKFLSNKELTEKEVDHIINTIPQHNKHSWGDDSFTLIG